MELNGGGSFCLGGGVLVSNRRNSTSMQLTRQGSTGMHVKGPTEPVCMLNYALTVLNA